MTEDGRVRRYVTVLCPDDHEYDVDWSNFNPKNGKPKRGCPACWANRRGSSKRADINEWCEQYGIAPDTPYTSGIAVNDWECLMGHKIRATFNSLKEKAKSGNPCTECALQEIQDKHHVRLLTEWTATTKVSTQLDWKCLICDKEFKLAKIGVGRKLGAGKPLCSH